MKYICLDTQFYRKMNFKFSDPVFVELILLRELGVVQILITDIVYEEVRKKAKEEVASYAHKFRQIRGVWEIIDISIPEVVSDRFEDVLFENWFGGFEQWVADVKAIKCTETVDAMKVFQDYIEGKLPFGKERKKSEFPDAFNLEILSQFSTRVGGQIIVVTEDKDYNNIGYKGVMSVKSLAEAIKLSSLRENRSAALMLVEKVNGDDFLKNKIAEKISYKYSSRADRRVGKHGVIMEARFYGGSERSFSIEAISAKVLEIDGGLFYEIIFRPQGYLLGQYSIYFEDEISLDQHAHLLPQKENIYDSFLDLPVEKEIKISGVILKEKVFDIEEIISAVIASLQENLKVDPTQTQKAFDIILEKHPDVFPLSLR